MRHAIALPALLLLASCTTEWTDVQAEDALGIAGWPSASARALWGIGEEFRACAVPESEIAWRVSLDIQSPCAIALGEDGEDAYRLRTEGGAELLSGEMALEIGYGDLDEPALQAVTFADAVFERDGEEQAVPSGRVFIDDQSGAFTLESLSIERVILDQWGAEASERQLAAQIAPARLNIPEWSGVLADGLSIAEGAGSLAWSDIDGNERTLAMEAWIDPTNVCAEHLPELRLEVLEDGAAHALWTLEPSECSGCFGRLEDGEARADVCLPDLVD